MSKLNYCAVMALLGGAVALFAGCDSPELPGRGEVFIESAAELESLRGVEDFEGTLHIRCGDCTTLEPLSSLTRVSHGLRIYQTRVSDLRGLEALRSVRSLEVSSNGALTSLAGLDNLERVRAELEISSNPRLSSLRFLERLRKVGRLGVTDNGALQDLQGLNGLQAANSLHIGSNDALLSFSGLESLETLDENLLVQDNPSLRTLEGLGEGFTRAGFVVVRINPSLSSLSGLDNVKSARGLEFEFNDVLDPCAVIALRDRIGIENIRYKDLVPTNCACDGEVERRPGNCP